MVKPLPLIILSAREDNMSISHTIFAAGCFWGVQAVFDAVPGVISTIVGYTGGDVENPTYELVCKGNTNHAEAVLIEYDDEVISFAELLDIYFASHDPTTLDRQGPDIGSQYRSAIFVADEEQEAAAIKKIQQLNKDHVYRNPIVTKVLPETVFYPAEEYHQKYLAKRNLQNCHITAQ